MSSSFCVTWFIITRNVHKSICVWVWGWVAGPSIIKYQKMTIGEYQNGGYDDKSLKIYGPN